jgi:hypothetical protein
MSEGESMDVFDVLQRKVASFWSESADAFEEWWTPLVSTTKII